MYYYKFDRFVFFKVLRRKDFFVRFFILDYFCILIDYKERIVFMYVFGNYFV